MDKAGLIEILRSHKKTKARRDVLAGDVEDMVRRINREAMNDAAESTMHGMRYDGVPGGGKLSKPVEEAGIRGADGVVTPIMRQWMQECAEMEQELEKLNRVVRRVECGLEALDAEELQVIRLHEIEQVSWREMVDNARKLFGVPYSQGTLRNKQQTGLEKMLEVMR